MDHQLSLSGFLNDYYDYDYDAGYGFRGYGPWGAALSGDCGDGYGQQQNLHYDDYHQQHRDCAIPISFSRNSTSGSTESINSYNSPNSPNSPNSNSTATSSNTTNTSTTVPTPNTSAPSSPPPCLPLTATLPAINYILAPDSSILHATPASISLQGLAPHKLLGRRLAFLVHEDDRALFLLELDEARLSGRGFRVFVRLLVGQSKRDGRSDGGEEGEEHGGAGGEERYAVFEACGHFQVPRTLLMPPPPPPPPSPLSLSSNWYLPWQRQTQRQTQNQWHGHGHQPSRSPSSSPHPAACNGVFFVSAQPYPSTPGAALDTFLGLRVEGLMLERKRAQLRAEEAVEMAEECWEGEEEDGEGEDVDEEGATDAGADADVEPPVLVKVGELGIPFVVKQKRRAVDIATPKPKLITNVLLRKRGREPEEFVCHWCDVTSAPEWRRGPDGPKTLCNACGSTVRWAKARKQAAKINIKREEEQEKVRVKVKVEEEEEEEEDAGEDKDGGGGEGDAGAATAIVLAPLPPPAPPPGTAVAAMASATKKKLKAGKSVRAVA